MNYRSDVGTDGFVNFNGVNGADAIFELWARSSDGLMSLYLDRYVRDATAFSTCSGRFWNVLSWVKWYAF